MTTKSDNSPRISTECHICTLADDSPYDQFKTEGRKICYALQNFGGYWHDRGVFDEVVENARSGQNEIIVCYNFDAQNGKQLHSSLVRGLSESLFEKDYKNCTDHIQVSCMDWNNDLHDPLSERFPGATIDKGHTHRGKVFPRAKVSVWSAEELSSCLPSDSGDQICRVVRISVTRKQVFALRGDRGKIPDVIREGQTSWKNLMLSHGRNSNNGKGNRLSIDEPGHLRRLTRAQTRRSQSVNPSTLTSPAVASSVGGRASFTPVEASSGNLYNPPSFKENELPSYTESNYSSRRKQFYSLYSSTTNAGNLGANNGRNNVEHIVVGVITLIFINPSVARSVALELSLRQAIEHFAQTRSIPVKVKRKTELNRFFVDSLFAKNEKLNFTRRMYFQNPRKEKMLSETLCNPTHPTMGGSRKKRPSTASNGSQTHVKKSYADATKKDSTVPTNENLDQDELIVVTAADIANNPQLYELMCDRICPEIMSNSTYKNSATFRFVLGELIEDSHTTNEVNSLAKNLNKQIEPVKESTNPSRYNGGRPSQFDQKTSLHDSHDTSDVNSSTLVASASSKSLTGATQPFATTQLPIGPKKTRRSIRLSAEDDAKGRAAGFYAIQHPQLEQEELESRAREMQKANVWKSGWRKEISAKEPTAHQVYDEEAGNVELDDETAWTNNSTTSLVTDESNYGVKSSPSDAGNSAKKRKVPKKRKLLAGDARTLRGLDNMFSSLAEMAIKLKDLEGADQGISYEDHRVLHDITNRKHYIEERKSQHWHEKLQNIEKLSIDDLTETPVSSLCPPALMSTPNRPGASRNRNTPAAAASDIGLDRLWREHSDSCIQADGLKSWLQQGGPIDDVLQATDERDTGKAAFACPTDGQPTYVTQESVMDELARWRKVYKIRVQELNRARALHSRIRGVPYDAKKEDVVPPVDENGDVILSDIRATLNLTNREETEKDQKHSARGKEDAGRSSGKLEDTGADDAGATIFFDYVRKVFTNTDPNKDANHDQKDRLPENMHSDTLRNYTGNNHKGFISKSFFCSDSDNKSFFGSVARMNNYNGVLKSASREIKEASELDMIVSSMRRSSKSTGSKVTFATTAAVYDNEDLTGHVHVNLSGQFEGAAEGQQASSSSPQVNQMVTPTTAHGKVWAIDRGDSRDDVTQSSSTGKKTGITCKRTGSTGKGLPHSGSKKAREKRQPYFDPISIVRQMRSMMSVAGETAVSKVVPSNTLYESTTSLLGGRASHNRPNGESDPSNAEPLIVISNPSNRRQSKKNFDRTLQALNLGCGSRIFSPVLDEYNQNADIALQRNDSVTSYNVYNHGASRGYNNTMGVPGSTLSMNSAAMSLNLSPVKSMLSDGGGELDVPRAIAESDHAIRKFLVDLVEDSDYVTPVERIKRNRNPMEATLSTMGSTSGSTNINANTNSARKSPRTRSSPTKLQTTFETLNAIKHENNEARSPLNAHLRKFSGDGLISPRWSPGRSYAKWRASATGNSRFDICDVLMSKKSEQNLELGQALVELFIQELPRFGISDNILSFVRCEGLYKLEYNIDSSVSGSIIGNGPPSQNGGLAKNIMGNNNTNDFSTRGIFGKLSSNADKSGSVWRFALVILTHSPILEKLTIGGVGRFLDALRLVNYAQVLSSLKLIFSSSSQLQDFKEFITTNGKIFRSSNAKNCTVLTLGVSRREILGLDVQTLKLVLSRCTAQKIVFDSILNSEVLGQLCQTESSTSSNPENGDLNRPFRRSYRLSSTIRILDIERCTLSYQAVAGLIQHLLSSDGPLRPLRNNPTADSYPTGTRDDLFSMPRLTLHISFRNLYCDENSGGISTFFDLKSFVRNLDGISGRLYVPGL